MPHAVTQSPVHFTPGIEIRPDDEAQTIAGLGEQVKAIQDKTLADYGSAVRGIHAKGHAIVEGMLEVLPSLPPELAQGLFATPGSFETMLRFSTLPGDILDDSVSVPRGLGIKVFGVAGDRLPGSENDETQDFVLVNGPAFASATPKAFLANLKLLAATTDRAEGLKKAFSATMQAVDTMLETVGIASPTVQTLGGAPNTHPLGETYYSQVPIRYGDYIAKASLAPVSTNLTELTGIKVDTSGRPDALREDMGRDLIEGDGVWELRVQLCVDLDKMPVEDASVLWDEKLSPFRAVARLTVAASQAGSRELATQRRTGLRSARGTASPRSSLLAGSTARANRSMSNLWHIVARTTAARSMSRVPLPTFPQRVLRLIDHRMLTSSGSSAICYDPKVSSPREIFWR